MNFSHLFAGHDALPGPPGNGPPPRSAERRAGALRAGARRSREAALRVVNLRCEYLVDPLGLDERAPRLSWALESPHRGARQTAWRVLVASSPAKLRAARPIAGTAAR